MKVVSPLDLAQNELRNAVLQSLAAAPSSPKPGQWYFDSAGGVAKVWNGSSWRPVDPSALSDGSIPLTALATNPLARANHTGQQPASTISDLASTVQGYRLDQFAAPTGVVSWNGQRISNVADPAAAQDAATRAYVDNAVQSAAAGIDSKPSVRVIATANVTLSGLQTIDGITVAAGDRILCAAQTVGAQNGVYVAASGVWSRAADAAATGEITPGAFWFVEEGSTYGKTQWRCNNTGVITVGTTSIAIVQFGAAALYSNGNGLTLTGTTFAVQAVAAGGLTVGAGGVQVDPAVVARKFSATITGDGATASFTLNPALGTTDLVVFVRDATGAQVLVDVQVVSATAVTLAFGAAPASGVSYRATIIG